MIAEPAPGSGHRAEQRPGAPAPAVSAIAIAPQKATRQVPFQTPAPTACAEAEVSLHVLRVRQRSDGLHGRNPGPD